MVRGRVNAAEHGIRRNLETACGFSHMMVTGKLRKSHFVTVGQQRPKWNES